MVELLQEDQHFWDLFLPFSEVKKSS